MPSKDHIHARHRFPGPTRVSNFPCTIQNFSHKCASNHRHLVEDRELREFNSLAELLIRFPSTRQRPAIANRNAPIAMRCRSPIFDLKRSGARRRRQYAHLVAQTFHDASSGRQLLPLPHQSANSPSLACAGPTCKKHPQCFCRVERLLVPPNAALGRAALDNVIREFAPLVQLFPSHAVDVGLHAARSEFAPHLLKTANVFARDQGSPIVPAWIHKLVSATAARNPGAYVGRGWCGWGGTQALLRCGLGPIIIETPVVHVARCRPCLPLNFNLCALISVLVRLRSGTDASNGTSAAVVIGDRISRSCRSPLPCVPLGLCLGALYQRPVQNLQQAFVLGWRVSGRRLPGL